MFLGYVCDQKNVRVLLCRRGKHGRVELRGNRSFASTWAFTLNRCSIRVECTQPPKQSDAEIIVGATLFAKYELAVTSDMFRRTARFDDHLRDAFHDLWCRFNNCRTRTKIVHVPVCSAAAVAAPQAPVAQQVPQPDDNMSFEDLNRIMTNLERDIRAFNESRIRLPHDDGH